MKICVSASASGVLPTGPYSNMRPSFSAEIECEVLEGDVKARIQGLQGELYEICNASMRQVEQQAIVERINRERADIRWYTLPDGSQVPSVTSIIGFDADFLIPPEELQQYASQFKSFNSFMEYR